MDFFKNVLLPVYICHATEKQKKLNFDTNETIKLIGYELNSELCSKLKRVPVHDFKKFRYIIDKKDKNIAKFYLIFNNELYEVSLKLSFQENGQYISVENVSLNQQALKLSDLSKIHFSESNEQENAVSDADSSQHPNESNKEDEKENKEQDVNETQEDDDNDLDAANQKQEDVENKNSDIFKIQKLENYINQLGKEYTEFFKFLINEGDSIAKANEKYIVYKSEEYNGQSTCIEIRRAIYISHFGEKEKTFYELLFAKLYLFCKEHYGENDNITKDFMNICNNFDSNINSKNSLIRNNLEKMIIKTIETDSEIENKLFSNGANNFFLSFDIDWISKLCN